MKLLPLLLVTWLSFFQTHATQKFEEDSRSLIYGGSRVRSESKYPYYAVVIGTRSPAFGSDNPRRVFCGGVLIAKDVVLTSGVCLDRSDITEVLTIFETIEASDRDRQLISASSWIRDEGDEDSALGLIFLENEVENIAPAMVSVDPKMPAKDDMVTIMGFGFTEEEDENSEYLMEVDVKVNQTSLCDLDYNETLDDSQHFCAGGQGTGACIGDTGGPAIDDNGDVVGITSFGNGFCGIFPTVFIRVSGSTDFLKSNVCDRNGMDDPDWCGSGPPSTGGGFGSLCFAGSSQVEVQTENGQFEKMAMRDLSIGDQVNTGNDVYEPVYSFGHHSPSVKAEMLQIKTDSRSTLRLSPNHLILTASRGALPASQVQIGDQLFTSSGEMQSVNKIDNVMAQGMFAPFTPSGNIVVDGILASSYVALEDSDGLTLGPWKISHQWMAHAGSFPHRMSCYYYSDKYCDGEKYSPEGISQGVHESFLFYKNVFETANRLGSFIRVALFGLVMVGLVTFTLIEVMMTNPLSSMMLFVLLGISTQRKRFQCKVKTA